MVALQNEATQEWSVVLPVQGQSSTAYALYLSQPIVTSLAGNVGSMAGGNPLTIVSNASAFNTASPTTGNQVTIGGVIPCPIVATSVTATSLTCIPGQVGS